MSRDVEHEGDVANEAETERRHRGTRDVAVRDSLTVRFGPWRKVDIIGAQPRLSRLPVSFRVVPVFRFGPWRRVDVIVSRRRCTRQPHVFDLIKSKIWDHSRGGRACF